MSMITIYTDGACKGNPGLGGWGAILLSGEHRKEIFGGDPETTNNRMELMACIEALSLLKKPCQLELFTDSNYVIDGITKWMENWKKNNWRTSNKQPVKNDDLWRRLDALANLHDIKWSWVKGHNGDELNERADYLANQGVRSLGKMPPAGATPSDTVNPDTSAVADSTSTRGISGRTVILHTDGSCLKNPGFGGWAAIIEGDGVTTEISGAETNTTNNRMEMMAAIQGLESTTAPVVKLITDSSYVMDGITMWLSGWKANGWKTKSGGPVKNIDLWGRMDRALAGRRVDVEWVRGHSGHPLNERADELARKAAHEIKARSMVDVTP